MKPYKANRLPFEYKIDKEMLKLVSEANAKYGKYKSLLETLEFYSSYFLESVLLKESYKSTQIEGTQITQEELYYLKYLDKCDDSKEIQNLKKTIEYAENELKKRENIQYEIVNEMHRMILDGVRGSHKSPGQI